MTFSLPERPKSILGLVEFEIVEMFQFCESISRQFKVIGFFSLTKHGLR